MIAKENPRRVTSGGEGGGVLHRPKDASFLGPRQPDFFRRLALDLQHLRLLWAEVKSIRQQWRREWKGGRR